jgi:hypothetical protein
MKKAIREGGIWKDYLDVWKRLRFENVNNVSDLDVAILDEIMGALGRVN